MIGQAWALLDWQSRLAAVLVLVLVALLATLAGGYIEWARAGGTRDLQQQLAGARGLLAGYSADAAETRAVARRQRAEAASALDRERSRRQAAEHELRELRSAVAEQGRAAARAAEVVDLVLWEATRAGAGLTGHPPP